MEKLRLSAEKELKEKISKVFKKDSQPLSSARRRDRKHKGKSGSSGGGGGGIKAFLERSRSKKALKIRK